MAVSVLAEATQPDVSDGGRPRTGPPAPPRIAVPRRPLFGIRAGQIVVSQAGVALLLAALGHGTPIVLPATLIALLLVVASWTRLRGRWLFEWLGIGLRYTGRQRALPAQADPVKLLDLLLPGAAIEAAELGGDAAALISDAQGMVAVLELGDSAGLLLDDPYTLPDPASLLPAPSGELPPIRIQLLLSGAPAPAVSAGGGTPATSYRQLTDGRLLSHERALLTIRVLRIDGWSDTDLRRALSSTVRKVRRRLTPVPARTLGERAALRVLAETAHHDDARPGAENWSGIRLGGLHQTTFRLERWPNLRQQTGRRLLPRLLTLPAMATTVSLTAGPWTGAGTTEVPVDLTIRLATPDQSSLSLAVQALRRLLAAESATARRLDGAQLDGFATTVPLGTLGAGTSAALPGGATGGPVPARTLPVATLDTLDLPLGSAGLMIGLNRHGAPVTARMFRAEATRIMLVGGVRPAQLIALRAVALGARVVVQTTRPRSWEPFIRGVSTPGGSIPLIPPGRPVGGEPGGPLQPLLVIVDVGPAGTDPQPGPGWCATLVVRDELAAADAPAVSRADLVLLQPLRPAEAAVAGTALGLGEAAGWLTRIRQDMVAVINRRVLRWALLSPTPIEAQLVGTLSRQ